MLFCFGLFALLLYYTVVANAECSYTYRHSSQQPIEARSWEYEKQGFTRCQFLIQLVNQHQLLRLNFTRFTGFGLSTHPAHHDPLEEGGGEEEEKEGGGGGWKGGRGPKGNERAGDGRGWLETDEGSGPGDQSQRSRLLTPAFTTRSADAGREWTPERASVPSAPHSPDQEDRSAKQVRADTTPWSKTLPGGSPPGSVMPTVRPVGRGQDKALETPPPCLPMVEIRAVDGEGREEMRHRICRQRHATTITTHTPIVFQYASSVRIVYEWALEHSSGFTLFFHFTNTQPERCVHTCDGASRCLSERRMLCDGRFDCRDRSDEQTPVCRLSTSPSASRPLADGENLVQIIVIPSCAVAVVVVLSAVCLIGRRRWHEAHAAMSRGHGPSSPRSCLQSHSSEGSVTRACSAQECSEQVVALLPSSHRSHRSWPSSHPHSHPPHSPAPHPYIELPPNIPVSPDGEEGYAASQLALLHPRYHSAQSDLLFRPPPNKTVFDRESPPPYSVAPSPGTHGCSSAPCPSTGGLGQTGRGWPGHERIVRDSAGQATVSRCCSMITPSNHHPPTLSVKGHPPRPSANPGCASPAPQTLPLRYGACSVKDTPSPSSPPQPPSQVVPDSSSSSSSAASSSSPASSSPAALLLSSSGHTAPSSSGESRTRVPSQLVCSTGAGQDHRGESSGDSSGGGSPQAPHSAQLGAPPSRQGAFSWTRSGEGAT